MSMNALQQPTKAKERTNGEKLFEEYLRSQGIADFVYEMERAGKTKKIDYTVTLEREYLFEVKDFTYTEIPGCSAYDPHERLRNKIGELRAQFREYKEWPCCGVLYNDNAHLVDLNTPMIVLGAMYGDLGLTMKINTVTGRVVEGSEKQEFLSRGKILWRKRDDSAEVRNTTISAVITVRHVRTGYANLCKTLRDNKSQPDFDLGRWIRTRRDFDSDEQHLGVIVWENNFARIPFPRDVFCGDFDERYGTDDEGNLRRIVAGAGLLEYEARVGEEKSPLFREAAN
jgi:hypothetical protein